MDRFDVINFADLSGPNGGDWVRIGGGSFGVVFKGEYLGTEVAIKEVLPNNTYDVEKYFERECVLMKEARHPNIVQYIGLTKSQASMAGSISSRNSSEATFAHISQTTTSHSRGACV